MTIHYTELYWVSVARGFKQDYYIWKLDVYLEPYESQMIPRVLRFLIPHLFWSTLNFPTSGYHRVCLKRSKYATDCLLLMCSVITHYKETDEILGMLIKN